MKRYLAIFTGSPEAMAQWQGLPEAQRKAREQQGVAAWLAWAEKHRADIVEGGGPLGRTKRITRAGITDIRNHMGAFTVVRAASHEAAARLFLDHPHFTIFPGDGVEVMEILPVPSR